MFTWNGPPHSALLKNHYYIYLCLVSGCLWHCLSLNVEHHDLHTVFKDSICPMWLLVAVVGCLSFFVAKWQNGKISLLFPCTCIPTPSETFMPIEFYCHEILLTLPNLFLWKHAHINIFLYALKYGNFIPHVQIFIVILVIHIYFRMANFNEKQFEAIYMCLQGHNCLITGQCRTGNNIVEVWFAYFLIKLCHTNIRFPYMDICVFSLINLKY